MPLSEKEAMTDSSIVNNGLFTNYRVKDENAHNFKVLETVFSAISHVHDISRVSCLPRGTFFLGDVGRSEVITNY